MGFSCGIVGLPNVGKSTLFNALTQSENAEAANYPFCTIDPNSGLVSVPDERLWQLKDIVNTEKVIPTQLELVDIAGLVKGASQGAGQGTLSCRIYGSLMRSCMWCAVSMMVTSFMLMVRSTRCVTLKRLTLNLF